MALKPHACPMHLDYMHLCDYAFAVNGGKAGVIGIFSQTNLPAFPFVLPQMYFVAHLRGIPGQVLSIRLIIDTPLGERLVDIVDEELLIGRNGVAFFNICMIDTHFARAGCYSVTLSFTRLGVGYAHLAVLLPSVGSSLGDA